MVPKQKSVSSSPAVSCRLLDAGTNPVDGAAMVWVPAGVFLMGIDDH
ncbi:MAG TPA: hypothetical protein VFA07_16100 [Chthonomonadaceae bacterium]|nr:hypothetical protein [Chthonomonadaceae bacterium]